MNLKENLKLMAEINGGVSRKRKVMLAYSEGFEQPMLVTVDKDVNRQDWNLKINMYKTNLRTPKRKELKGNGLVEYYHSLYSECEENDWNIEVSQIPTTTLEAGVMWDSPFVASINTSSSDVRKGYGSYALALAEDIFAKSNNSNGQPFDYIRVHRNCPDGFYYISHLESKLGAFGNALAYSRAKHLGANAENAFVGNFLINKNGYIADKNNPYDVPRKKLKSRHIIPQQFANFDGDNGLIQIFDKTLPLTDICPSAGQSFYAEIMNNPEGAFAEIYRNRESYQEMDC